MPKRRKHETADIGTTTFQRPTKYTPSSPIPDEVVLDCVISQCLDHPSTFSELFANICHLDLGYPVLEQIEVALDILNAAHALNLSQISKYGTTLMLYSIPTKARLLVECPLCLGSGVQNPQTRGLCPMCHGNQVVTPDPLHPF